MLQEAWKREFRAADALSVDFARDIEGLERLAGDWKRLAVSHADHESPFFQSYAWCRLVAGQRATRSPETYRILIAVLRRGGKVVGIMPLSLQRSWRAWIVRMLDEPYGQFAGALFERREDIAPGVTAIVSAIRKAGIADAMSIDGVIDGTPLSQALAAADFNVMPCGVAPVVDLRPFASHDAYQKTISVKTRKNLRNSLNRLQRTGVIAITQLSGRDEQRASLNKCFAKRLDWLNALGKSSAAFRDADFVALVDALSDTPGIALRVSEIRQGERVLAQQWGFDFQDRYYAYMSARDPEFADFSVGRLHLSAIIANCFKSDVRVIELMPPDADYKMMFTSTTRSLVRYATTFNANGWLVLSAWQGRIYPALQKASRSLPNDVRQKLATFVNGAAH